MLDLNGKSIVADETIGAKVTDGAKLTVRDSAEGGKIQLVKYGFEVVGDTKYTDGSKPDPSNAVSSTLTLEGGTIANSGGYAATVYPYGNGATLNVTGGTIENTYARTEPSMAGSPFRATELATALLITAASPSMSRAARSRALRIAPCTCQDMAM